MSNLWRRNIFSETKVLPLAVLCSMVIYTVFALFYYHIEGWFESEKGDIGSQKETIPLNSCKSMFGVGILYSEYQDL